MKKNLLILFSLLLITDAWSQVKPAPESAGVRLRRNVEITSTQDNSGDKSLSVYPNPTSGIINLSLSGFHGKKTTVSVMNVIGTEIYRETLPLVDGSATKTIDLRKFVNGVYYVKLEADDYSEIRKIFLR